LIRGWTSVSRLREAMLTASFPVSRFGGRSQVEKIMLKQQAKAKYRINLKSFSL
jgi:hypothetical protein